MNAPLDSSVPKRVAWINRWGIFGISWFASLALLIPLVVGGLMFGVMHELDSTLNQSALQRSLFIVIGALLVGGVAMLIGLVIGVLTYLVFFRRWYTPPTAVFVLMVLATGGVAYLGLAEAASDKRTELEAQAQLERMTEQARLEALQQLERDGIASHTPGQNQEAIDGLREVSRTASDPNKAAMFAIAADIGQRSNDLVDAYFESMGTYLEVPVTEVPDDITEDQLLGRIETIEIAMEKNAASIEYLERLPVILKTELANRTTMNAPTRDHQADVFLKEFTYDDVMIVRRSEQEYLVACREQLMILLDTFGLWTNTPEGFDFAASVEDSYLDRFNAAFEVIQRVAEVQAEAQRRIYGAGQP